TNAAMSDAAIAVADFVMNIGGGEHRPFASVQVAFVEAALDPALALPQLLAYLGIHSKSLSCWGDENSSKFQTPQKAEGFRDFSFFQLKRSRGVRLFKD